MNANESTPKVPIASRVPAPLADELVRLAELGNRSVSREIWAACAEHVAAQSVLSSPLEAAVGRGGAMTPAAAAGGEDRQ